MKVRHDEGVANHIGPEPCGGNPRGLRRSVGRGAHRPAIEPRKLESFGRRRRRYHGRQHGRSALLRAPAQPGVVKETGMCGSSLHGNREVSGLACGGMPQVRVGKTRSRSR